MVNMIRRAFVLLFLVLGASLLTGASCGDFVYLCDGGDVRAAHQNAVACNVAPPVGKKLATKLAGVRGDINVTCWSCDGCGVAICTPDPHNAQQQVAAALLSLGVVPSGLSCFDLGTTSITLRDRTPAVRDAWRTSGVPCVGSEPQNCAKLNDTCKNPSQGDAPAGFVCCPGVVCSVQDFDPEPFGKCCMENFSHAHGWTCSADSDCCPDRPSTAPHDSRYRCESGGCCKGLGGVCQPGTAGECCSGLSCDGPPPPNGSIPDEATCVPIGMNTCGTTSPTYACGTNADCASCLCELASGCVDDSNAVSCCL